ncbi:adenylate kinase [Sinorhizobium sp. Sb3]|uniref:adenylate kinase n=1 Tax=Sinorhizobium sp. Sb3 TaxID=1358417 RepID=UPI0009E7D912|nr:adenylate kinase [Sinorhizobium sp. Sb3]
MVNLVLIGAPGAGKGTQAERLVRDYGLLHISTGDLLRQAIAAGTPLGLKAKEAVGSGELVPDKVVIGLVEETLADKAEAQGFILDGFPRTLEQARALEGLLRKIAEPLHHVVVFDIPIGELAERIAKRVAQSSSSGVQVRSDDNTEALRRRIDDFTRATVVLLPFYEERQVYQGC